MNKVPYWPDKTGHRSQKKPEVLAFSVPLLLEPGTRTAILDANTKWGAKPCSTAEAGSTRGFTLPPLPT